MIVMNQDGTRVGRFVIKRFIRMPFIYEIIDGKKVYCGAYWKMKTAKRVLGEIKEALISNDDFYCFPYDYTFSD